MEGRGPDAVAVGSFWAVGRPRGRTPGYIYTYTHGRELCGILAGPRAGRDSGSRLPMSPMTWTLAIIRETWDNAWLGRMCWRMFGRAGAC
ncbi:hypothetical protein VTJ04DRAFT_560 [Mycothermus thermophilus]|uniref:uncharacterized protein n=1 Tax=Humicola insolens TaxID=85995 RepID=UPI0037428F02